MWKNIKNGESNNNGEFDGPVISTTAIAITRWIGKFVHLIKVLPLLGYEIYAGIIQIVEYYMYSIYSFFGSQEVPDGVSLPPKLLRLLLRIQKLYAPEKEKDKDKDKDKDSNNSSTEHAHVRVARLSSLVTLADAQTLYGISARIVACESLRFIQEALNAIKDDITPLLKTAGKEKQMLDFYKNTVDVTPEMMNFIMKLAGMKFIGFDQLLVQIYNTKWDTKEIGVEHNQYINFLLSEFGNVSKKMIKEASYGCLPNNIKLWVYDQLIRLTMDLLVEGYSRLKKCSAEGRAIMSLDIKVLQNGLEKMTSLRPIPNTQYVDNYIKALYITDEADFTNWATNHPEYSVKQCIALINLGIGLNLKKQAKQALITAVEELDKSRKRGIGNSSMTNLLQSPK